jgi:hypothetical protein
MTVLARAGTPSESLTSAFVTVVGNRERAAELGRAAVARTPGLSSDAQAWLAFDQKRQVAASGAARRLAGAQQEDADYPLALLTLDAQRLFEDVVAQGGKLAAELGAGSAASGAFADVLFTRTRAVASGVKRLAERRGIEVRYEPGDVVDFSASAHELAGGGAPEEPKVRIVSPLVVRTTPSGLEQVIVRARVTNLRGERNE